jgi:hypothetical protein
MQVRMSTFVITPDDRRAIRFAKDRRKTMCTRNEAKEWIDAVVNKALRDLRYRWHGPQADEAILSGADPEGLATHEPTKEEPAIADENVEAPAPTAASPATSNGATAPQPVTPQPVPAGQA